MLSMVQRADSLRVKHILCTMREPGPLARELPNHVAMESFGIRGRDRLASIRLAGAIRRHRPNIVHARNWNTWLDASIASRLAATSSHQLVLGYHGLETDRGFSTAQKRLTRWLRLSTHQFTTVSHAGREELTRDLNVPGDRIRILANGVDTTHFAPPNENARRAARMQLDIEADEVVAVMVGALVLVKDHLSVLDAFGHLDAHPRRLRLLIAGDGPLRKEIAERATHLDDNIRVSLLGWHRDVSQLLKAADVLIIASRYEQMSNALLEAMACGLAVIATDVGDSARVLDHGHCGALVPPCDTRAMARAIARVAHDPTLRLQLGQAARTRVVDNYGIEDSVERYTQSYSSWANNTQRENTSCAASLA